MDTPKMTAGVDLIRRTGAKTFRVGYSDPDEGKPVVWYACCVYKTGQAEAAAAFDPESAVLRLCERLVDGGVCTHCHKATAFEQNFEEAAFYDIIGLDEICVYGWDPELKVFRRGCE